jgi:hypothetical protein
MPSVRERPPVSDEGVWDADTAGPDVPAAVDSNSGCYCCLLVVLFVLGAVIAFAVTTVWGPELWRRVGG